MPNNTLTTLDSVPAMSEKPSLLKSATVSTPVMPMVEFEVKVPVPVPRKRVLLETLPDSVRTTISILPSLLKSPSTMLLGKAEVDNRVGFWKVPLPLPRKILTLLLFRLVVRISILPSPFTSPVMIKAGDVVSAELYIS